MEIPCLKIFGEPISLENLREATCPSQLNVHTAKIQDQIQNRCNFYIQVFLAVYLVQCSYFLDAFFSYSGADSLDYVTFNSRRWWWCACPVPSLPPCLSSGLSRRNTRSMDVIYNNTDTLPTHPPTRNPFHRALYPSSLQHPFSCIHLTLNILRILTAKIFRQMVRDKFHLFFSFICG